jgi:acetolactate synthase-1/3 small subunit
VALALSVVLDQDLLTLNRAIGIIRRRNLAVTSLAVGPVPGANRVRLTLLITAEEAVVDRLVQQLRKMPGVWSAMAFRGEDGVVRELALLRVQSPPGRHAAVAEVVALFGGSVVEEGPEELVVQVAGSNAFVLSFLRALEPFGITDLVRSGAVALERGGAAAAFSST